MSSPALADAACEGLEIGSADEKAELAALTVIINTIYNLDITKTRE